MANWIELETERYLSADKMTAIYNNFLYLNEQLKAKGYTIYDITDNSVTYGISPEKIINKMSAVESNIQAIENAADWINPYYKIYEWVNNATDKKTEVDRWIMYINFAYKALSGTINKSSYLIDIDGNYITEKSGNYILVYKE